MKTLVIVPAYNEEESIQTTLQDLIQFEYYDILVINDGSTDKTAEKCSQMGINCISLPFNMGLSGAFETGVKYAYENDYDVIMQFDADGQHLAKYINPMLNASSMGYDIVVGSRFKMHKPDMSLRQIGASFIRAGIKITTGQSFSDPTSGMRAYSRRLIEAMAKGTNYTPEPDTIAFLMRSGATMCEIQVEMRDRIGGKSYLTSWNSVKYMVRMAVSIFLIQFFKEKIILEEKLTV